MRAAEEGAACEMLVSADGEGEGELYGSLGTPATVHSSGGGVSF